MDIYKSIIADHEIQRSLSEQLSNKKNSDDFPALWKELKQELEVHASMEERYFYKPLISSDATQEDARHGMHEHHEIEEAIEKVEDKEMGSEAWFKAIDKLKHEVEHHLDEEEEDIFPKAKKVIEAAKAEELCEAYEKGMREYRDNAPQEFLNNSFDSQ